MRELTLDMGTQGQEVEYLQTLLTQAWIDCGNVDGVFGQRTHDGVMHYQAATGLLADGVVGPHTWAQLLGHGAAPDDAGGPGSLSHPHHQDHPQHQGHAHDE